jgi:transposase
MRPLSQESNPDILRQAAILLEKENTKLVAKVMKLQREVLQLKGVHPSELQLKLIELERQLANSNRARFGRSTEKRETPKENSKSTPQKGHGPKKQAQLEVVPEVHHLDDADKACTRCGGMLAEWNGQFEESELVDSVERTFFIRKVKRQKYRCACGGCVETALGPTMLIPGGRYAPDFAVEVAISKYLDHLPLQRQVKIMAREGLEVTASTLWDQIEAAANALESTYDRIRAHVLSSEVIGIDETHWKMLGEYGGEHEQKNWQTWAIAASDAVAYKILPSRSAEAAREVLGNYSGIAMADGYGVYEHVAKDGHVTFAGCWAHVRRKFIELENSISSKTREEILALIGELYAVER